MMTSRMMKGMKSAIVGACAATALVFAATASAAPTYFEPADGTGDLPGSAEEAGTDVRLINGLLRTPQGGSAANVVDLYSFSRSAGGQAYVWTSPAPANVQDPVLYLFDGDGRGLYWVGQDVNTGIAGFTYDFLAGDYFLAIAFAGIEPFSAIDFIFDTVGGSTLPLNDGALLGWQDFLGRTTSGGWDDELYAINIIEVPEPATAGLALLAFGLSAAAMRRRRAQR